MGSCGMVRPTMSASISPRKIPRAPVTLKMWPDIRLLWRHMLSTFGRRRWIITVSTSAVLLAVALWLLPQDATVLRNLQMKHVPDKELRADLKDLSGEIGKWGDFAGYNLALVGALWLGGRVCKSRYFQRLAVASMLCAIFAGLVANTFRFTMGRPRPRAIEREGVADGLYGPQIRWNYNSFPSGHTATAFGSAIPLAVAMPVVGVPALASACSVSWARMFGNQHHPSDVAVAIWIAVIFGVPLGLAVRRTRFTKDGEGADAPATGEKAELSVEPTEA